MGNVERTFDENDDVWKFSGKGAFKELNWINNYQSLFRCPKCSFNSNTFSDFIGNEKKQFKL